ncbi:MAG: DUF6880 family protein [Candidatus Aenigmatarchaeota archaeon]
MSPDFDITEKDIIESCGSKAFERGLDYYRQNRVKNLTIFGNTIKSTVMGGNKYIVEIKINKGGIDGRCTCPVGDSCKHVAAALLFLKYKKNKATKVEDIESHLSSLSKSDLVRLILSTPSESMLKTIKLDMVARKKSKLDIASYKEEMRSALEIGHYFDYNETFGLVSDLTAVKNSLEKLIDLGFYNESCSLLLEFLSGCVRKEEECDDSNGDLGDLTIDVGNSLAKAFKGANIDEIILQELIRIYKDAADYGVEDAIHNAIKGLDKAKLRTMETLVKSKKDSEFKWLYREIVNLQGRHEEYIKMCCDDKDYLEAVDKLVELGKIDDAIKLAKEKSKDDDSLQERLFELLLLKGNKAEALSCAWKIFKNDPSDDNLKKIKETSAKLGAWKSERGKAVAFLEASEENNDLLVMLCIEDNSWKKALANMKGIEDETAGKLGAALEGRMPQDAIKIYRRLAENNIQQMGNERYKAAKRYLQRMKRIHKNSRDEKNWQVYIKQIREAHKPKRNFIAEIAEL